MLEEIVEYHSWGPMKKNNNILFLFQAMKPLTQSHRWSWKDRPILKTGKLEAPATSVTGKITNSMNVNKAGGRLTGGAPAKEKRGRVLRFKEKKKKYI
ncbi:hypothetical protein INR49_026695 [Caranx melampygus]|nr:hypothetical protein INR49_026695 [Caranx melampygus]